ncbi:YciI family protein [Saccharothrix coeruleofusca]|uniref:YCII-related domain-containing protein n=1 Tax=Saccharothrix coeruleofusca TaxID=33919 RepID=A0A918EDU3_9PSEU|nr:YciI family protein [Saccharothrix coeruleofusca]MBP2340882.1 uncharacterized protein YciI [Saccharothrix coeruleofusca]GGP60544.1 hypothetical protein GCM10010185_36220 [Saccharothrix coeruleofusca]
MYIVLVRYTKPLDQVDCYLPDHVRWLNRHYEEGHFLASGRQVPCDGCVIIARPMPRRRLDALLATDPFAVKHLARHEVVEFLASRTAPELARVNEAVLT